MTDHANELRRYSRKIGHPAGDVPSVMLAAADEIERLAAKLEAAEKERDDVAHQLVQSEQGKRKISEECGALREESDTHKALIDLLRAEVGWLRARIEAMERQEPVAWMHETRRDSDVVTDAVKHVWGKVAVGSMAAYSIPLYTLPDAQTQPAPSVPSEEAAAEMGANGGHVVEAERLAFEAWMRGHCWKLGAKWTGTEYRSAFEKGGMVDMHAMRTRELWAAWRDRAALAAAPEAKPCP